MEEFFRRVLPDGGQYVAVSITEAGPREIRGLPSIAHLVSAVQRLSMHKTNVYYAVGTYDHDRKSPVAKRALFLDLDAKTFGTKADALREARAFCNATGMVAPSIYVDSGRGIHLYWCLDRDISVADWRVLADALKARCVSAGFKADPTVTADGARVLRVPGTLNHKELTPLPCRVLKDTGTTYDPAHLLTILSGAPAVQSRSLAALSALVGADDLGTGARDTPYPQVPYYATEIVEKCGVFKEALATGGRDHTEPQWRHLLSLLTFTEDGEKLVHEISKGHDGYSEASTNAKYAAVLKLKADGTIKPVLCSTFATYKNSICSVCPYNGHIKTPMVLGKIEATAYLPYPFRMGDYSVQRCIKKEDGDIPAVWADVFPYRISDVEVLDPGQGQPLQVRMLLSSKQRVTKFVFPHVLMSSQGDSLPLAFAEQHLWTTTTQIGAFKEFMTTWLRKMTDIKDSVSIELTGLGWGRRGGKSAFVAGASVHTEDGKEHDFFAPDPAQMRNYRPKGDPALWQLNANAIVQDPRQAAVTTLLTAFAAPLVSFTGVKGLTFSLYSQASGTGKSFILRTAQAVWGHPTHGMAMVDDTQLSVVNKIGFLNTIPVYWDELRSSDTFNNFVKMIFTLGQGRERARLTSSIKQQSTGSWDTLVALASNERIADHVDQYIKSSDAGRVRLFEISLGPLTKTDATASRANSKLENNYGHAGIIYGKYLATHRSDAEKLVHDIQDTLRKKVSVQSSERYWVAFVAAILSAAILVERAGLLTIKREELSKYLLAQLKVQQGGVEDNYVAPDIAAFDSVAKFIDAHRSRMLLVDTFNGGGLSKYGNIVTPSNIQPRDEIWILKAVDERKLRIHLAAWRSWVSTVLKHSPSTLQEELGAMGVTVGRVNLSAGMQNASNARIRCLEIDLTGPFAPLLDEEKQ
jgi:Domain of unknown function (DUF927)